LLKEAFGNIGCNSLQYTATHSNTVQGEKVTLVGTPDPHILQEAIEELQTRTTAGAATFLVKVKAYRGGPANEEANI